MACITINDKSALQKRVAEDGNAHIIAMLEKVGVMDSIQSKATLRTKITNTRRLSDFIIANSYAEMNLTNDEAIQVGEYLKQQLGLEVSPITINAEGKQIYDNNYSKVQMLINDMISQEFVKTATSVDEGSDALIMGPIITREKERISNIIDNRSALIKQKEELIREDVVDKDRISALTDKINALTIDLEKVNDYIKHLSEFPNMAEITKKFDVDKSRSTILMGKATLTWDELTELKKLVQLWKGITDPDPKTNILKLDHELNDPEIAARIAQMGTYFHKMEAELHKKELNKILAEMNNNRKPDEKEFTINDITRYAKDEGKMNSLFRGLRKSEMPLLRRIAKVVSKANDAALSAFKSKEQVIDDAYHKVKSKIPGGGTDFSMFIAKSKDGNPVGQLVSRFSFEFWNKVRKNNSGTSRQRRDWLKNNTMVVKFEYLFDDISDVVPSGYRNAKQSEVGKAQHIERLKENLGEDGFNEYIKDTTELVEDYFKARDSYYESLLDDNGKMSTEAELEFRKWDDYNSPFKQSNNAVNFNHKGADGKKLRVNKDMILRIPLKYNSKGQDLGYYDNDFANIEADKDLYEFYNSVRDIIQDARVSYGYQFGLNPNALPYLEKTLADQITSDGFNTTKAFQVFADGARDLWSGKEPDNTHIELDEMGNLKDIKINKGVTTIDTKARQIYKFDAIEFEKEHGRKPNMVENQTLMEQAYVKAGENQDLDLLKLVKLLAMNATAYKHKTIVKGEVELMTSIFRSASESNENPDMPNAIAFLENTLKADFYGRSTKEVEGNLTGIFGGKGRLTSENRRKAELLEFEIDKINSNPDFEPEDKAERVAKVQEEIDALYNKVYASEIARSFLGYARVLGIGWNLISATTNLMFGQIGNFQRAIQGDHFGIKDISDALYLTIGKDAMKIEAISHKFGLVGDQSYSLKKQGTKGTSRFTKVKNALNPYMLQTVSEGFNQKPIMVAIMKKTVVKKLDGSNEESNAYDILDENGNIDPNFYDENGLNGDEMMAEVMDKVRDVVGQTHGDYNSTLLANNKVFTQSLLMFKRWLAEMLRRRFGKGGIYSVTAKVIGDLITGRRSRADITSEEKGKIRAALIGDVGMLLLVMGVQGLLKDLLCDKPDCKDAPPALMGTLNLLERLESEIGFFMNPANTFQILENPIAGARILEDMWKAMIMFPYLIDDSSKKAVYRSNSRYAGQNKAKVAVMGIMPFGNQLQRFVTYGNQPSYKRHWGSYFENEIFNTK